MRFIITFVNKENKKDIMVVRSVSKFKAIKKAYLEGVEKGLINIKHIRPLYNPIFDKSSSWMFKPIIIPDKFMQNYLYWDKFPKILTWEE